MTSYESFVDHYDRGEKTNSIVFKAILCGGNCSHKFSGCIMRSLDRMNIATKKSENDLITHDDAPTQSASSNTSNDN